jgi:hypothetical protein
MSTHREIAKEIVDYIRDNITELCQDEEECDPWDEDTEGAGWLDNEIGMAIEFLKKINVSTDYPKLDYDTYNTVEKFQQRMEILSMSDLKFIKFFIIELGGSSETEFFSLRNKNRKAILKWFKNKGFSF